MVDEQDVKVLCRQQPFSGMDSCGDLDVMPVKEFAYDRPLEVEMILDEQDAHRPIIRPLARTYDSFSAYRDDLPWCSERGLGGGVTAGLVDSR